MDRCIEPDCETQRIQARGLCDSHYRRHRSAGTLDEAGLPKYDAVRKLRDIDPESMTLTCPQHGPGAHLRVRVRATKNGRTEYSCLDCRNEQRRGKPRPNRKPPKSRKGQGAYLRTIYPPDMSREEIRRHQRLKWLYGLTPEQVDQMRESQHNACLICRSAFDEQTKPKIDHCHDSGRVRGLLCNRCNSGLGMFLDDPDRLRSAITYLAG